MPLTTWDGTFAGPVIAMEIRLSQNGSCVICCNDMSCGEEMCGPTAQCGESRRTAVRDALKSFATRIGGSHARAQKKETRRQRISSIALSRSRGKLTNQRSHVRQPAARNRVQAQIDAPSFTRKHGPSRARPGRLPPPRVSGFPFRLAFPGRPGKMLGAAVSRRLVRSVDRANGEKSKGAVFYHVGRPACPIGSISRIVTMAGMAVGRESSVESSPASRGRSSPRRETSSIMRRLFVVSMFSLSVAGCAQSRSALTDGTSPKAPVAITPIPSPYDNINTGVGGPAAARMAIKDPSSPQWYGRAQPDGTTTAGQVAGAGPSQATAPQPAADRGLTAPAPLAAEMPQTSGPSMGVSPLSASSPSTVARPSTGGQAAGGQPAAPPQSAASGLEFIPSPPPGLAPAPLGASPSTGSGPAAGRQSGIPLDSDSIRGQTVPDATAASLTSPLGSQSMPAPAAIPSSEAPKRGRDPLLGPDPDLMPPIPDVSELKPPARAPAGPLSPSATAKPAGGPMTDAISSRRPPPSRRATPRRVRCRLRPPRNRRPPRRPS